MIEHRGGSQPLRERERTLSESNELSLTNYEPDLSYEHFMELLVPENTPEASKPTRQEVLFFLELCRARSLNPFVREIHLVKYAGQRAHYITGKDAFISRANSDPNFNGLTAGIIVENTDGSIERLVGSFMPPKAKLLGGWCDVWLKSRDYPSSASISLSEYSSNQSTWSKIPATMIRKVAVVQALREAFPERFGGLYDSSEMQQAIPQADVVAITDGNVNGSGPAIAPPPPEVEEEPQVSEELPPYEPAPEPQDTQEVEEDLDAPCATESHWNIHPELCRPEYPCKNVEGLPIEQLRCPIHYAKVWKQTAKQAHFTRKYKRDPLDGYSHPVDGGQWCNRSKVLATTPLNPEAAPHFRPADNSDLFGD